MVSLIIILIIILFVGGIILLGEASPFKRKSRPEILRSLAKFLDGRLEPIEQAENSFRIRFTYEGREFVYEDWEEQGIQNTIYKTYLKLQTPGNFTLNFTEKSRGGSVRSDLILISKIDANSVYKDSKVQIPKELQDFNIHSNNPVLLNDLFQEPKIIKIFSEFKNRDNRGRPFMTLKIIEGAIILEFPYSGLYYPKPLNLQPNFHSLEVYLERLFFISKKLIS
ncbi:MAG TPA: hypothetical protein DD723_02780 [Candidatus Omnitrophica bacterium]|nr:MAG: hypothetical protein A2Z81_01500 [Omnitrophica WOR_2 bacterium GWA2_45_18]HBR14452.1 hypothetical protein [Candidatus Omnitrophota bacterium]